MNDKAKGWYGSKETGEKKKKIRVADGEVPGAGGGGNGVGGGGSQGDSTLR